MNIPGYTILRKLGAGGMATVYLALQERLQREVALKVLNTTGDDSENFTARFIRESRIVARLQHPGIVIIHDFDSVGGYHYFSMEHLPGGTLEDRLQSGLPTDNGLMILAAIADALAYAHGEGIVHRDIKPQNILFRADDTPVLSDFGIAWLGEEHAATKLTRVDAIIGSPRYMSPEQIMGQPLDARSDLYSLGILCYELITGSMPFPASDPMTLAMRHCTEPLPTLAPALSPFQPFIDRITAKEPGQRFGGAAEVATELRRLVVARTSGAVTDTERTIVVPRTPPGQTTRQRDWSAIAAHARRSETGETADAAPTDAGTGEASSTPARHRTRLYTWLGALALLAVVLAGISQFLPRDTPPSHTILEDLPAAPAERRRAVVNAEQTAAEEFSRGDIQSSLEWITLGLKIAPDDPRLLMLKERIENHRDAEEIFDAANALAEQNNLAGALELVQEGLLDLPDAPQLLRLRDGLQVRITAEQRRRADALAREAQRLKADGDYAAALDRVDAALQLIPDAPDLVAVRTNIAVAQRTARILEDAARQRSEGNLSGALATVLDALTELPDQEPLLELQSELEAELEQRLSELLEQAKLKLDSANPDGAEASVEAAAALLNDSSDERLAVLRTEIADLRRRLDEDRENELSVLSILKRIDAHREAGQLEAARDVVAEGRNAHPTDPRIEERERIVADELVAEQEAQQAALANAEREQRIQSSITTASRQVAAGDIQAAQKTIQAALETDPEDARLRTIETEVAQQIADERQSAADAALQEARSHLEAKRFQAGIDLLEQALKPQPQHPQLLALLAELKAAQDRQRELEELVAEARTLYEQGAYDAAIAVLDRALTRVPDEATAARLRGQILSDRDAVEQRAAAIAACRATLTDIDAPTADQMRVAMKCWSAFSEANPDDPDARAALDAIRERLPALIETQVERKAPEQARALAELLADLDPGSSALAALLQAIDAMERRLSLLPQMVAVEGGCFRMGSPSSEALRETDERPHTVCLDDFEIGRHEVTVAEFRRFVEASNYLTDAERDKGGLKGCHSLTGGEPSTRTWGHLDDADWRSPVLGRPSSGEEPVSCVSWHDANAYIDWLNSMTGERFRLPTEAEWEYAARAGTQYPRYWGGWEAKDACRYANVADDGNGWADGFPCDDDAEWAREIGSFTANDWGLFDMLGNVWEWTCSIYDEGYRGAETRCDDSSDDSPRVFRGGSWYSGPQPIRAAVRNRNYPEARYSFLGLRLAHDGRDPPDDDAKTERP